MPQDILKYFALAMLTGVTVVFPISSSGHIVIYSRILGTQISFDKIMFLHLGSFVAILIFFRRPVIALVMGKKGWNLLRSFLASFLATGLVGLVIEEAFGRKIIAQPQLVALLCVVNGIFLWGITAFSGKGHLTTTQLGLKQFLFIGAIQGLAAPPGLSRLGLILGAGLIQNLKWSDALELSFMLSLPTILAANLFEFSRFMVLGATSFSSQTEHTPIFAFSVSQFAFDIALVFIATVASLAALNFLARYAFFERHLLFHFGLYCAVTGFFFFFYLNLF